METHSLGSLFQGGGVNHLARWSGAKAETQCEKATMARLLQGRKPLFRCIQRKIGHSRQNVLLIFSHFFAYLCPFPTHSEKGRLHIYPPRPPLSKRTSNCALNFPGSAEATKTTGFRFCSRPLTAYRLQISHITLLILSRILGIGYEGRIVGACTCLQFFWTTKKKP